MKLYKLTDQRQCTRETTKWGKGVTHKASGEGSELCTEDVIHAYKHPLLALLLNPIHADIKKPQLWEAEGDVINDDGLKVGCKELTTTKRMRVPKITTEHRVRFAILCALEVYDDKDFAYWAKSWMDGSDRTESAAWSAAWSAAERAASAAERADSAAWSAAWSAAERAASAAERAAARAAASAAARAAASAARAADIDLEAIAEKAVYEQ